MSIDRNKRDSRSHRVLDDCGESLLVVVEVEVQVEVVVVLVNDGDGGDGGGQ